MKRIFPFKTLILGIFLVIAALSLLTCIEPIAEEDIWKFETGNNQDNDDIDDPGPIVYEPKLEIVEIIDKNGDPVTPEIIDKRGDLVTREDGQIVKGDTLIIKKEDILKIKIVNNDLFSDRSWRWHGDNETLSYTDTLNTANYPLFSVNGHYLMYVLAVRKSISYSTYFTLEVKDP